MPCHGTVEHDNTWPSLKWEDVEALYRIHLVGRQGYVMRGGVVGRRLPAVRDVGG